MAVKVNDQALHALDSISSALFNTLAMADFEARLLSQTYLSAYSKETQLFKQSTELKSEGSFPHGFTAVNLLGFDLLSDKRESITLSGVICQGEGRLNTLRLNFNDHICWQLVNVYELFETFIKDMYALFGCFDNRCWRCADYGLLLLGQIEQQDLSWFKLASKKILDKNGSSEILKQLRRLLPDMTVIEGKNPLNWDLQFEIALIEQMRHVIVHKRGNISLNLFTDAVGKKMGIAINAETAKPIRDAIHEYFIPFECEEGHKLLLADLETENGIETGYLLRRFDHCVRVLASFGATINKLAALHFGAEPR